jgi:hypothetical protein
VRGGKQFQQNTSLSPQKCVRNSRHTYAVSRLVISGLNLVPLTMETSSPVSIKNCILSVLPKLILTVTVSSLITMLPTLIAKELWTNVHLFRRAVTGLLVNSLLSFTDLLQPLFWAVLKLSVSTGTASAMGVSTDTALIHWSPSTVPCDVNLTSTVKTT